MVKLWGVVVFLILFSCQSFEPVPQNEVKKSLQKMNLSLAYEPQLDPRVACDSVSRNMLQMLFEGLTRIGPDGSPHLAVAEKVSVEEDGLRYIFTLRACEWSNKEAVTAYDFEYTWKSRLTKALNSPLQSAMNLIKNREKIRKGELTQDHLGVKALSTKVLEVELETPIENFLEVISDPVFFPISAKADKENPSWAEVEAKEFVGNGPFSLEEWKHFMQLKVVKSDSYWDREAVTLEKLNFVIMENDEEIRQFSAGTLDWLGFPFSYLDQKAMNIIGKKQEKEVIPLNYTVHFNQEKSPFNQEKVRRSFSLSIQRQLFPENINVWSQSDPLLHEDVDLLVAETLFTELSEKTHLELTFKPIECIYPKGERNYALANYLVKQWESLFSVKVHLIELSRHDFRKTFEGGAFQLACFPTYLEEESHNEDESLSFSVYFFSQPYLKQSWVDNVQLSSRGFIDFKWGSIN